MRKSKGAPRHRIHSAAFKLKAVERMEAGESVAGLSRELGVRRKLLYEWRNGYRERGLAALNRRPGRQRRTADQVQQQAARQMGELERKVGRQALQIDFLQRAFKRVKELRQQSTESGGTASTE